MTREESKLQDQIRHMRSKIRHSFRQIPRMPKSMRKSKYHQGYADALEVVRRRWKRTLGAIS